MFIDLIDLVNMQALKTILDPADVNLIVYHANCSDGFGAALCGYLIHGDKINYYAAKYLQPGKDDLTLLKSIDFLRSKGVDPKILMVDFSYQRPFLLKLKSMVSSLIVLDHHETAMKDLSDLEFCHFDMKKSGARLAWEYFFPTQPAPLVIRYIEDRDLWKWEMPKSREFSAAFYTFTKFEFPDYAQFIIRSGDNWLDNVPLIETYINKGSVINEYLACLIGHKKKNAKVIMSKNGKSIALIDEPHYASEMGEALAQEYDYALLFYADLDTNTIKCSLRSTAQKSESHCGKFAKQFGGGGHPQASGFVWSKSMSELIPTLESMDV